MKRARLARILPKRILRAIYSIRGIGTFWQDYEEHLQSLTAEIRKEARNIVQSGPFAGMVLSVDQSWGDMAAKLLGTYECELFPVIKHALSRSPDCTINIGAAEGYYAVGIARAASGMPVHAFDISTRAQETARAVAQENGVADRVFIRGKCDGVTLKNLVESFRRPLIIMDCEGAELSLIVDACNSLINSSIIVECHDFIVDGVTESIYSTMDQTHHIEFIHQGPRNPHIIPQIAKFGESDRWTVLSERRSQVMHWLYITPKSMVS